MNKTRLVVFCAICTFTALACGIMSPVPQNAPSASGGLVGHSTAIVMTPISTACDVKLPSRYVIIADAVYLRSAPAGSLVLDVNGNPLYLTAGAEVVANCHADAEAPYWCAITQGAYQGLWVWQGCIDSTAGLSCEPLP
jgi:hypothetical protein